MTYHQLANSDVRLSEVGLGGHEFLPDGRVKAMGEDFHRSVTPGIIWEGFGQDHRRHLVQTALEAGVNFFDITVDAEKDALGRNLEELSPVDPIYVQTRPEGMVYKNDPADEDKQKLLSYDLLREEARRAAGLLRRPVIDIYNFGIYGPAVQRQPGYLDTLARNIGRLKREGLIRFACADGLSAGESLAVEMIETGAFEAIFTNLSPLCDEPLHRLIPTARKHGLAVFAREAFVKGRLFTIAEAAGITDRARAARASVRWILSQGVVTSLVVGVAKPAYLSANIEAAAEPTLTADDEAVLDALRKTQEFTDTRAAVNQMFLEGWI
jgi:aryl-alcohol dehydrogenase-like predicted oxidoreductase